MVVALLVAGVIPLLLGLLFELVIVAPLRVPLDQTPLFYPWQVLLIVSQARTAFYLNMYAVLMYFYLSGTCRIGLLEYSTPKSLPPSP